MPRKREAFILLERVIFQDAFCCLCHARMWVDLFLQCRTREPASDLQTALVIRHIVHWWIMCGPESRYTAFKIAHLSCKPHSQRSRPFKSAVQEQDFLHLFFPVSEVIVFALWFIMVPWQAEDLKTDRSRLRSWRRSEVGREFFAHC